MTTTAAGRSPAETWRAVRKPLLWIGGCGFSRAQTKECGIKEARAFQSSHGADKIRIPGKLTWERRYFFLRESADGLDSML